MKKIILISILLLSVVVIFAQDYKVIKVNGVIVLQGNNSTLETGSTVSQSDELEFRTSNARAAVFSPSQGRFVIMPDNKDLAYAKASFTPAMSNMASRSGAMINLSDLENKFTGNFAIINQVELKVSDQKFPMDNDSFFYLRYKHNGETINKKLESVSDTLILNRSEILKVDDEEIIPDDILQMEILYMKDASTGERVVISSFAPIFVNETELKSEVSIILDGMKKDSVEDKVKEITSYINDFYGKTDLENTKKWLKENDLI